VAVSGAPPGRDGWRVQVQDRVLTLANAAVSTSGDEFQYFEIDGARFSHILDPRTGKPLRDSRTVSVIANRGIEADSLATAWSVIDPATATNGCPVKMMRAEARRLIADARCASTRN
jgi:thiamine biosynthesis lipoprotein